jgi:arsenate reductase
MPKSVTIYHNPRCSKSRQTLALLEEKGIKPKIVEYLKTPPSTAELKRILKKLGLGARDILRKGEPRYAELGLKGRDLKDDALIALMIENPILIDRPIVVSGDKAALGRPPEAVLKIV